MTYRSAVVVEKIPAWECQSGSDEPWFDVPKGWDPLSNTKAGGECLLPEKTKNNGAVHVHADIVKHTEAQIRQLDDSYGFNISPAKVENLEGGSHCAPHDDTEDGFLSIDLSSTPKDLFVTSPETDEGGNTGKEKHLGKQRKRKRK